MEGAAAVAGAERREDVMIGQGFDAVALSQARRLYGLAFSILGDAGEAEDAVQDSLVLAWKAWDRLRDESARSAWITRICVNHCVRRRGLLSRLPWPSGGHGEVVPDAPQVTRWTAEISAAADPRRTRLSEALDRLSVRQRAVLTLHYHHGYSLDECAGLIGCRPGTARSHLARGLATLREELDHVPA
jgi:RNA polymerase sigma factor (sigma-70 family)